MAFCAGALVAVLWFTMAGAGGSTLDGAAGGGAGGASGGEGGGAPMGPAPANVRVAKAQTQMLRQRIAVVGRLHELQRATVAAEVEGKILEVPVQEGDPVIAGETVLARIDGVWAEQNLKSAQADVAAAQATLDQSELDLKYLEQLREAQSAKPKEVDDMRAKVASDRARLSSADADRDRVRREVERLVVLAPFDGAVTRKITEVGQWVSPGDDIVEVISQGQVDAIADVPEGVIDQVRLGDTAAVVIDPLGLNVSGEVVALNPNGQNAARTFPVKVRLDDRDGKLKAGMSVTVWLPIGAEAEYLTVPQDAVMYTVDGKHVWVGVPGSEGSPMPNAASVSVRPLFAQGERVAVEAVHAGEGKLLADGVTVVVEGAESLFPGQPLNDVGVTPTTQ